MQARPRFLVPPRDPAVSEHFRQRVRAAMGAPHVPHIPVCNPVSLDRANMSLLQSHEYMVAFKADGVRQLLVLTCFRGDRMAGMVDRAGNVLLTIVRATADLYERGCVFDGELCQCTVDAAAYDYLVFDAVEVCGRAVRSDPYSVRLGHVRNAFMAEPMPVAERLRLPQRFIVPLGELCNFLVKETEPAHNLRGMAMRAQPRYRCDGFIFTPVTAALAPGRDKRVLKWKEKNPIDVRLVVPGCDMTRARLFVDNRGEDIELCTALEAHFQTVELQIDSRQFRSLLSGALTYNEIFHGGRPDVFSCVIEVDCTIADASTLLLRFMRMRRDKDGANEIDTVLGTLGTIRDNICFDELLGLFANMPVARSAHRYR